MANRQFNTAATLLPRQLPDFAGSGLGDCGPDRQVQVHTMGAHAGGPVGSALMQEKLYSEPYKTSDHESSFFIYQRSYR